MSPQRLNWRIVATGLAIAVVAFGATALITRDDAAGSGDLPALAPAAEPEGIPTIPLLTPVEPLPEPESE